MVPYDHIDPLERPTLLVDTYHGDGGDEIILIFI
jgi:hypothetical protein